MSNLVPAPFEPNIEKTASDLTRFEALHAEKRELESGIESEIWEIDRIATSELKLAEEELQETNLECATILARLEKAAEKRFELGEGIPNTKDETKGSGVDPAIPSPRGDTIRILGNTSEENMSIAEPILSPVPASSDLDSFTVISDIDAGTSRVPQFTSEADVLSSENVLDPMANASERLMSLVQRYHSLCHTIGTLRDSINKQAEAMNKNAVAKLENAKMRLETSRGEAREIVEGMRKTSDSRVNVQFPWVLLEEGIRRRLSVVTPPPLALRTKLHIENGLNHGNSSSGPQQCDSRGPLTPPPTSHPHSPTFEKYDKMMNATRSRQPGDLWPWDIPWPALPRSIHNFPVKTSHSLLARDVVGNSVTKFIESYAGWKGHPIHRVRAKMLTDWTSIVDMTPVWRAGQREMAELIVHYLSDFV